MADNKIKNMTEAARIGRIGELLTRAVARKFRKQELEKAKKQRPDLPYDADPILIFISQVGESYPSETQGSFPPNKTLIRILKKSVFLEKKHFRHDHR